jgi:uncharacterized cupredoxin-like copper-binding protein
MKTTTYIYSAVCGLLLSATFASCSSVTGDDSENKVMMEINTSRNDAATTKADDVNNPDANGKVLFYQASKAIGTYFTSDVVGLNTYNYSKGVKFNTGHPYPTDGSMVYAVGYAPLSTSLITPASASDFTTLTLVDGEAGNVDVLTSRAPISGTKDNIFNEDLIFDHTLTKVSFYAVSDKTMQTQRNVKDIRIDIPTAYLPTTWKWNATTMKYEVQATPTSTRTLEYGDYLVNDGTEKQQLLGVCYLNLSSTSNGIMTPINLKCNLQKYGTSTWENDKEFNNMEIQLKDSNDNNVTTVNPGEAYKVIFKFTNDAWALVGVRVDWETGGSYDINITPTK